MGDGRSRRHAHAHTNEQTKQNETDNTKQTTKQTRNVRCMRSRKVESKGYCPRPSQSQSGMLRVRRTRSNRFEPGSTARQ